MISRFFVTGIGTEIGKTVVAAIFTEALKADYWKPVQAGLDGMTDTERIAQLAPSHGILHPEAWQLKAPESPHSASEKEKISIRVRDIRLPQTHNHLVVEGAGGLLVPLNRRETMLDLAEHLGLPIVLVSRHYLGSINHTLLSLEALEERGITPAFVVFIGDAPDTESVISDIAGPFKVFKIPETENITSDFVVDQAARLHWQLAR